MKSRLARWRLGVLIALLVGTSAYRIFQPEIEETLEMPSRIRPWPRSTLAQRTPDRLRVLFIGNSLTFYNGSLPYILSIFATSSNKNPRPVFDQSVELGATLMESWDEGKAQRVIAEGNWDYVVLQDHTESPIQWRAGMSRYMRSFAGEIKKVDAKPVFFMTWARADEPASFSIIQGAYEDVARENHGLLVPVGLAWKNALSMKPKLRLHNLLDNKHPTPAGSYLTACVFYSFFYHESAKGLSRNISEIDNTYIDLDEADANFLADAAWATVTKANAFATSQPVKK